MRACIAIGLAVVGAMFSGQGHVLVGAVLYLPFEACMLALMWRMRRPGSPVLFLFALVTFAVVDVGIVSSLLA